MALDPGQRIGIRERSAEFGVDDGLDLAWLLASGIADRPLALGVAPRDSVSDQLAAMERAVMARAFSPVGS